ncbi:YesL family protein [Halalkalibacterium halodurans]|uniref:Membrane protein YesL n=1 Tax=Halalkalibacterium halodurans TaxID=86665 RepID=A0A0M0KL57_ALKHA|nr:DUF624 domain-containing protein [Halalkalibacterium halodurans]TPE71023.1 DUF624 domain-containing protein [Halalkalibacterium halodurans]
MINQKMVQFAHAVYFFTVLNLLWLLGSLLGLGVFGVMPATVALFSVIRAKLRRDQELQLVPAFFDAYKTAFVRSNVLGLFFGLGFYVLYVNAAFATYFYEKDVQFFIYLVVFFFAAIMTLAFINLFSIMAHFEMKTIQYVKAAIGLVFVHPLKTVMQFIWLVAYVLLAIFLPKVFLVVGVSVISYVWMSQNLTTFIKKYAS